MVKALMSSTVGRQFCSTGRVWVRMSLNGTSIGTFRGVCVCNSHSNTIELLSGMPSPGFTNDNEDVPITVTKSGGTTVSSMRMRAIRISLNVKFYESRRYLNPHTCACAHTPALNSRKKEYMSAH